MLRKNEDMERDMDEVTDEMIVEELGRAWRIVAENLAGEDARSIERTIPTREQVRSALPQVDQKLPALERVQMAIATAMMPTYSDVSGGPLQHKKDHETE